jgi:hypothetical protein
VGVLELRREGASLCHFLDGRRVQEDAVIELLLSGNRWLRGQYTWSGLEARWPGFRVTLGGPWEREPSGALPAAVMALHPRAIVRWPVG